MSLVEAVANVAVGYVVALGAQLVVFPAVGLAVSLGQNLVIGAAFSAVSVLRSYVLRRLFEWSVSGGHNEEPPPRRDGGLALPAAQSAMR
jgi:hypothetical protein